MIKRYSVKSTDSCCSGLILFQFSTLHVITLLFSVDSWRTNNSTSKSSPQTRWNTYFALPPSDKWHIVQVDRQWTIISPQRNMYTAKTPSSFKFKVTWMMGSCPFRCLFLIVKQQLKYIQQKYHTTIIINNISVKEKTKKNLPSHPRGYQLMDNGWITGSAALLHWHTVLVKILDSFTIHMSECVQTLDWHCTSVVHQEILTSF